MHGARDSAGEKVLIAAGDPSGNSARHALGHEEPKARAALLAAAPVVFGVGYGRTTAITDWRELTTISQNAGHGHPGAWHGYPLFG